MQITFIYSNQIFQISSFVLYAKKFVDKVNVISFETNKKLSAYCEKLGVDLYVSKYDENLYVEMYEQNSSFETIFINLDEISFSKLEQILNINFEFSKDVEVYFTNNKKNRRIINNKEGCFKNLNSIKNISWVYFSTNGLQKLNLNRSFIDLDSIDFKLDDYEESSDSSKLKSEIKISKLNKPLLLFGIPGLILILSSFILVSNVVSKYDSIDSISLGTAIITIGTTVVGILSLMSAIISYVLGKQTEFLLTNYSE
tara:strand:- start:507 stop:1274 length:768 start_codon:yes stop_codon:yes gene_type:complete